MALADLAPVASSRVTMRPVAEADLPDLLEVNGDPEVTRFLPYKTWTSLDDGVAWLKRMEGIAATGTGQQFVVASNDDARVIGSVLVFRYDEPSARAELGYVLGRRHWGRGLMREMLLALCRHVFATGAIRRFEAEVDPDNAASNRLLRELGFVREGTYRQRWITHGATHDTHIYGLLASDWQGGSAAS